MALTDTKLFNFIYSIKKAKIGNVTVDASVSEVHNAASEISTNPIEDGADITDHVRNLPLSMTMQGIISDTPITFALIDNIYGLSKVFGKTSRSQDEYAKILKLRDSREPFDVVTGLRVYKNMILKNFQVNRTAQTGKSISFTAELQQIEIVKTKNVEVELKAKVDKGKKTSDVVPPSSPLSADSDVVTGTTKRTSLQKVFDFFKKNFWLVQIIWI